MGHQVMNGKIKVFSLCLGLASWFLVPVQVQGASPASQPATRPLPRRIPPAPKRTRKRHKTRHLKRRHTRPPRRSLLGDAQTFWAPRLRFVWRANREYWGPRARFVYRANREYWAPRVRFVWHANKDFWLPKLRFVLSANKDYWVPRIEREFLPYVRKRYRFFRHNYGKGWAKRYARAIRIIRPVWAFPQYLMKQSWRSLPPTTRRSIKRVPAPVKIAFDKYLSWSLRNLYRTKKRTKGLAKPLREQLDQLSKAMVLSKDIGLIKRLRRTLARLRPYVADPAMASCYRVVALQSQVINAFNTGCTCYITSALAKKLNDTELAAVLAHEISHGDQGHAVKNMGLIAGTVGQHSYRLIAEEIEWFLTGRWGPVLTKVIQKGNVLTVLRAYGKYGPKVELEADVGATVILLRAGISPKHLVAALMKLHGKSPKAILAKDMRHFTQSVRHYPSLYMRVKAVTKRWRTWNKQAR